MEDEDEGGGNDKLVVPLLAAGALVPLDAGGMLNFFAGASEHNNLLTSGESERSEFQERERTGGLRYLCNQ